MNRHWQRLQQSCQPYFDDFRSSLPLARETQARLLLDIIHKNADSHIGRSYRFSDIESVEQYQARVPIQRYEDLQPAILNIANGEKNLLYSENTLAFEQTSGSTCASKLIPITPSSLAYLRRGIFSWLYDIVRQYPKIGGGKMYWSVSPQTRLKQTTGAAIAVGLDSDIAYLGEEIASALAPSIIAIDSQIHHNHLATWRWLTVYQLLCNSDINFISVWSPTFLLELFNFIQQNAEECIAFVSSGRHPMFTQRFPPNPERAAELKQAISASHIVVDLLWPQFQLLSCWTHGSSERFISALLTYFTAEQIQGKGILATEGLISIPLHSAEAPVLALSSGFFEFIDRHDNVHLCDDVIVGEQYRVVTTFANGLYRYDIGDYVKITGFHQQAPMLQFIGRSSLDSDLCGEKFSDAFVAQQLANVRGFAMMAPELQPKPHYVLYLDDKHYCGESAAQVISRVEQALRQNPQYHYARQLNQLDALSFALVNNPSERYIEWELKQGKLLGDIKPPSLRPETNWNSRLCAQ